MTVSHKARWQKMLMDMNALERHLPKACPYCGGVGRCHLTGGTIIGDNHSHKITKEQWREIYEFVTTVQLPFIHSILTETRRPKNGKRQTIYRPRKRNL